MVKQSGARRHHGMQTRRSDHAPAARRRHHHDLVACRTRELSLRRLQDD
jgi:hypothetical protein